MHARHSILLLVTLTALPAALSAQTGRGTTYRDPAGRFTLAVPGGWRATPQAEGVVVTNGAAMAVVTPMPPGGSPEQIVGYLGHQYSQQWQNLSSMDQGQLELAGLPAAYGMFSGINPNGVPALLRISGVVGPAGAFAVIISAPQDRFNGVRQSLQGIESSLAFGDTRGGRRASGAPPAGDPSDPAGDQPSDPAGNGPPRQGGGLMGLSSGPGTPGSDQSGLSGNGMNGGGRITLGALGMAARDVEQGDLPRLGIREARGALVDRVAPGSAAALAGIMPGDLILTVGRESVTRTDDLARILSHFNPGATAELTILRQGAVRTMRVRVSAQPNSNSPR